MDVVYPVMSIKNVLRPINTFSVDSQVGRGGLTDEYTCPSFRHVFAMNRFLLASTYIEYQPIHIHTMQCVKCEILEGFQALAARARNQCLLFQYEG